ncbi:MAG: type II toxin-antitoxin system VapC family toxin [Oscillatoriales cyanobacterium RU_3_3]|nr:type II toxin-antitoxin system VapC family toxin [Microcoleus sp. SU_5_6]NJL66728.1 type II toxin-antitoxin system VapC family toxin [Microcoleus sp. SM1_3_4]NJM62333.1 type II toxin-antitoxin system VapC family toxin [Oscillatoriales cyanobacterium RU_3_3]NJR24111.1 type II toxin-antitoxin system VapC family toxin [Richelia sp. CSU_2_1]
MRVLLDTHTLIWFFEGNSQISDNARILIEDEDNNKLVSAASVWEMAIKNSKGHLNLTLPFQQYIEQKLSLEDFNLLNINLEHIYAIVSMPFHHKDPFDRVLIAQSIIEGIPILSKDSVFDTYSINRIW